MTEPDESEPETAAVNAQDDDTDRSFLQSQCSTRNGPILYSPNRPSTLRIFLFHFVLPVAFLILLSIISDVYDSLSSPPTILSPSKGHRKTEPAKPRVSSTRSSPDSTFKNEIDAAIKRKKKKEVLKAKSSSQKKSEPPAGKGPRSSPAYLQMEANIMKLRAQYKESHNTPVEYLAAIQYADYLKYRDVSIHDGGTHQMEAIEVYYRVIALLEEKWRDKMARGEETRSTEVSSGGYQGLNTELFVKYEEKSIEAMLCAVYTNLGKVYFMSNMFDRAVESYEECLSYDTDYLDSLTARAQSLLILGKYAEAARDYKRALELDVDRFFVDAVSGMAKVLTAKEEPGGWDFLVQLLEFELPKLTELHKQLRKQIDSSMDDKGSLLLHYADGLKRMHHAMFAYHHFKTKNASKAWDHLSKGNKYKMSTIAPFDAESKKEQVSRVKMVFTPEFFPASCSAAATVCIGSQSRTPIFIIGFVRSGSTLLERILDAHPLIVGTGEDSVFNGRLDDIRNQIVEASMSGDQRALQQTVKKLADDVVAAMKRRWAVVDANMHHEDDEEEEPKERNNPVRFVDKMLTNYINVGFIHLLFPNALILHVVREPMDCIFSAYRHDFPPGGLDYTSEFPGLAQLYHSYRDVMEHWDNVLPGRVTHIRYEDLVTDFSNVATQLIEAVNVPWDPKVLDFHKQKQAVNTLSTTQVRKGVYSHHFNEWKRYETFLEPLSDLVGNRAKYDLKTSLPGYLKTGKISTRESNKRQTIQPPAPTP